MSTNEQEQAMSNEIERVARALNLAGWTCSDGAHEPGDYGRCEACASTCDVMARAAIAAMTPTPQVVEHGPVMTWRNDGGPWHESNKCKCGARPPHPTPQVVGWADINSLGHALGLNLWGARSFRADVRIDFDEDGRIIGTSLLNPDDGNPRPDVDVLDGDTQPGCTGDYECPAPAHQHGCMTDVEGHCNEPEAHPTPDVDVLAEVRAEREAIAAMVREAGVAQRQYEGYGDASGSDAILAIADAILDPEAGR